MLPEAEAVAEPSLPLKQLTWDEVMDTVTGLVCATVALALRVQPIPSVIVTVYVPEARALAVDVVWACVLFQM